MHALLHCVKVSISIYTEQQKKCTSILKGNLIIVKTTQSNCLVWVKSANCDKPCASCTTRHHLGMNGLRWVILVCWMSSQISWITRFNCSMGYMTVGTLARAVYRLHLIHGSPVWGRLRKKRRCTVTQWSHAARRCRFTMGPRYGSRVRSLNRLRWLRVVYVDIRVLWRPGFP